MFFESSSSSYIIFRHHTQSYEHTLNVQNDSHTLLTTKSDALYIFRVIHWDMSSTEEQVGSKQQIKSTHTHTFKIALK